MLQIGMFLGDRYEILEKIGTGGMADVYKARCHKLNRLVAVKVLKPEYCKDKSFVTRFRVEAQAAAGLTHPNIVNVYDVGDEGDLHYIVMELVEGITLKEYIAKKGRLDIRESIGISIQVAQGINAAHQQHIIHRDIKPQNIIISKDGKVKVTDFGIAHAASGDTINSSSGTMGSVHYTSPEQARGGYCDESSDIYSLGITLYEMLTGKVPFDGDNTVAVALAHIQNEMVPPRQLNPTIPVSLEKIILKCTQKKPERRYASAVELIADLRKALLMPDQDFVKPASKEDMGSTQLIGAGTLAAIRTSQAEAGTADEEEDKDSEEYGEEEYDDDDSLEGSDEEEYGEEEFDEDDYDDEDDLKDTKFDKVILGAGIAVAVLIVVLALYVIARAFGLLPGNSQRPGEATATETAAEGTTLSSTQTRMPNLLGVSVNEVEQIMSENNLKASYQYEYSDEYEKNYVCRQEYEENEILDKQAVVTVWISNGKEEEEMPKLSGLQQEQAVSRLNALNLNLNVKIETEYSDEQEEGVVTRTDPDEGEMLKNGDSVTVYVSMGEENTEVEVPRLDNMTQQEAQNALTAQKLNLGNVTEDFSNNIEAGHVISQSVQAGTMVESGTSIDIVISKGKQRVSVPSVVGSTEEEAKSRLTGAGLTVIVERRADDTEAGRVLSQDPAGGTEVDSGSEVTIVVSSGKEKVKVPDLRGKDRAAIEQLLSGQGLSVTFTEEYSDTVTRGMCISQNIAPNTEVDEGTAITCVLSLGPRPTEPAPTEPTAGTPEAGATE